MQSPKLAGVRAKIRRANDHLLEINTAVEALLPKNDTPQTPLHKYTEGQELIINSPKPEPLHPAFSLFIGDYIHNLRSALDHLVFQLAMLHGSGAEAASRTAFPVYLTAKKFHNFCDRSVTPFISNAALTEIEKLQPYASGNAGEEDIIWILAQLDIIDKHRLLVVADQQFRAVHFTITVPTGETFDVDIPDGKWKPLKEGAELIRFKLAHAIKRPGPVKVNIKTAKTVKLCNTGLVCDEFDLAVVLDDCKLFVTKIVDDFGKKFFGE